TCGGTLYSQSGFLTSPGYPGSYDENINCTWTIVGPVGHYLALHVLNVDIANSGYNCSRPRGILQIREMNETGDLLSQLCKLNAAETKQVDTASNIASIIFKAGDNPLRKYQGFRIMYNTSKEECGGLIEASEGIIQSPGYPFGYSHRRRCDWHIRGPPGRKITIQFLDVDIRNSSYTRGNYSVHYCMEWISFRNGNPDKSTYVPSRGICNPEGNFTYSSSMNEMMLSFVTYREGNHRGFKARFTTDQPQDCGGQLEATSGTLVSPGFVDGNYNHSLYCLWTVQNPNPSNSSFVVSFPYLHLEDYCFDWIDIEGVDESGVATLIKRVCSNHAGDVLVNYPTLRITFITDSYINHIGWNMTYSLTSCGGHKKGPQDIITSPNYPQQYPNNALCAWTFEYHEGDQIKLDFTNFALEDAIDHDYVHVYNGLLPTSPLLGTYSGTTSPGIVGPSMSHNLFVTFNSDDSVSNTGFRAIASQVERGCGGIYHQSFGNFSTHGFPNDYPANSECVWEIRFQPSYHVILSFLDRFDIETSSGCQNDFVEVSNGQSENTHGPVVYTPGDKLCGKAFPPTIVSSNNAVRILFRSNDNIQGQGFKISWTQGCGSNFSASTGYIMSPNHPERYPRNANCIYGIIAPASSRVIINFITFRVEGGRQCPYDSVQIYEGSIQKYKFCGLNADEALSGPIILRSPVMLKFVSDWSVQYQGFLANYTIIPCGGNITRGGIIEVPQENIYDMYCTWDITAPEGKIVHFKYVTIFLREF
ncbi:cubilin-like, partial [Oratosquilla oratoria]|uniref:cubilin-like n=1 Tax=Oratosquilla oratoria TaxID=337810 RepID=UPI003F75D227